LPTDNDFTKILGWPGSRSSTGTFSHILIKLAGLGETATAEMSLKPVGEADHRTKLAAFGSFDPLVQLRRIVRDQRGPETKRELAHGESVIHGTIRRVDWISLGGAYWLKTHTISTMKVPCWIDWLQG
jgi:hypothetical protein